MDKWKGGVGEEDDGHDTADVISQNVFTKSVRRVWGQSKERKRGVRPDDRGGAGRCSGCIAAVT